MAALSRARKASPPRARLESVRARLESELGPLLEYDATHSRPLIPTLVAYLHHACSKSATARALHIERRTLYYRLEHIERLLDRPLEDPAGRLRLEVALQGLGILRT